MKARYIDKLPELLTERQLHKIVCAALTKLGPRHTTSGASSGPDSREVDAAWLTARAVLKELGVVEVREVSLPPPGTCEGCDAYYKDDHRCSNAVCPGGGSVLVRAEAK